MAGADLVTILFTDLVGSTATLARLGEEAADELRQAHFAILREAIGRSAGREVKNLGDGQFPPRGPLRVSSSGLGFASAG
jgi:class 3 adenylate cyclase